MFPSTQPPPVRWGILGASWIGDRAVIPALMAAANCQVVAIASRDRDRAAEQAAKHGIGSVHDSYERLLADDRVEAVYIPLVNSLHRDWTLKALAAGKHVLCEKPLAPSVAEAEEMAAAAASAGRCLMEALMYRFHPRMRDLRARIGDPVYLQASFGFPLRDPHNYRLRPELGGGALLDVGIYTISVARWFLGEPERVRAVACSAGVDISVAMSLGFEGGGQANLWCSFDSPERQELLVVTREQAVRIDQPFTAWRDPDDPYQVMVEEFVAAVRSGRLKAPLPVKDSIANLRVVERVREEMGAGG